MIFEKTQRYYQEFYNNLFSFRHNKTIPSVLNLPEEEYPEEFLENIEPWIINYYQRKITPVFIEDYKSAINMKEYFWGCEVSVFINKYQDYLKKYSAQYKQSVFEFEDEAIENFLKENTQVFPNYALFLYPVKELAIELSDYSSSRSTESNKILFKIEKNRKQKVSFLNSIIKKQNRYCKVACVGYDKNWIFSRLEKGIEKTAKLSEVKVDDKTISKSERLNWNGTELELVELLKALIESKKITGHTDKLVFNTIYELFSLDYTDAKKKDRLATIRHRTIDKTPLITQLEINLKSWIDTKDN